MNVGGSADETKAVRGKLITFLQQLAGKRTLGTNGDEKTALAEKWKTE